MRARIKRQGILGIKREEDIATIDEIIVKEDLFFPEQATINVYFKGANSSGILSFSRHELERLSALSKSRGLLAKKKK